MVTEAELRKSPRNPNFSQRSPNPISGNGRNGENSNNVFSPRFKSVAAMAGWDEETLLIASLIVDDTPDRDLKQRKRLPNLTFKTPPLNSRRKRRDQRRSPAPIQATVLNLDEEESQEATGKENGIITKKQEPDNNTKQELESERPVNGSADSEIPSASLGKLREELSCAICLEICYEPSTTSCGHSFCKKCLRSAAEKCGKRCPKCRQLISSARSCTINTVLWDTIQLLFPKEVEARKLGSGTSSSSPESNGQDRRDAPTQHNTRRRPRPPAGSSSSVEDLEAATRRRAPLSQDEDAALALRLQREEFLEVIRGGGGRRRSGRSSEREAEIGRDDSRISISMARENLRAMASRAISLRVRGNSSSRPI